jgi:UDP-N-acetylmuramate dehydrogenase
MTLVTHNQSLKKLNSFGMDVFAKTFICLHNVREMQELLSNFDIDKEKVLILGEGSNILFTGNFNGLVIHPCNKGIEVMEEDNHSIDLNVAAGENWDEFVEYCTRKNYGGLENLSLIPGSVGSAPVQNIGAYGVEVKERIIWVEGLDLKTGELKKIYTNDCGFGYRKSIFKQELKNRFIITSVHFKLHKNAGLNLSYGPVKRLFEARKEHNIQSLRETIIEIRESKLPDYKEIGNAGSFFKNPVISISQFQELQNTYPEIPSYPSGKEIKLPAAWLIEKAGWKGVREKDAGTWPGQPLVIVNYGNSSGKEILNLAEKIQQSIHAQFGIELEMEVNVY